MAENKDKIGYIVSGGLKESFRARLTVPAQDVQEGAFVVLENANWRFYGLVTDIQLGATDPRFADEQTEERHAPHAGRTNAIQQGLCDGAGYAQRVRF